MREKFDVVCYSIVLNRIAVLSHSSYHRSITISISPDASTTLSISFAYRLSYYTKIGSYALIFIHIPKFIERLSAVEVYSVDDSHSFCFPAWVAKSGWNAGRT